MRIRAASPSNHGGGQELPSEASSSGKQLGPSSGEVSTPRVDMRLVISRR
jgi:hypothetical protein